MAWNPSPEVAVCRDIARKWRKEQIIIIALDAEGNYQLVTFGQTTRLCACAKKLGEAALNGMLRFVRTLETMQLPIATKADELPENFGEL